MECSSWPMSRPTASVSSVSSIAPSARFPGRVLPVSDSILVTSPASSSMAMMRSGFSARSCRVSRTS